MRKNRDHYPEQYASRRFDRSKTFNCRPVFESVFESRLVFRNWTHPSRLCSTIPIKGGALTGEVTVVTAETLMKLSRDLLEAPCQDYIVAAAEQIRRLIPGEDVCWVQCNWDDDSFVVWRTSSSARDPAAERVLPATYDNPAIQSYVRAPYDLSPRRLSDIPLRNADELVALRLSEEYIGPRQISMIVNVKSATIGKGWIITRGSRDFGDQDLDTATRILPVLYLLDRFHHPDLAENHAAARRDLTAREGQVIDLLTTGLTAAAIGHVLGISQRTVSKHIQNAYIKLGIHDRLLVARDRQPA